MMWSRRLKMILPRSLYGRTALILIVPLIVVQVVLSVVFIQRHYERVTAQMTRNSLNGVSFVVLQVETADDPRAALDALADLTMALQLRVLFHAQTPAHISQAKRANLDVTDLAGREIVKTLRRELPSLRHADLQTASGEVQFWIDSRHGILEFRVARQLMSAQNPHQLLVIVFLASSLMGVIAFQFLRLQIRPIRRLAQAAEAYGRGEMVPIRASGAREVRAAALAFQDMRNRLQRQVAQQRIMLSGVSHDMRTPLTRMRLILSMMDQTEDRDALEVEIQDLQKRLDGFLDYSRGQSEEKRIALDPVELVRKLVERYRATGRALSFSGTKGRMVLLQPAYLERAVDNLVSNALRFGKTVSVCVLQRDDRVEIVVEDDGPGIPIADRARVCEPFVRLDEARNARTGGMGLGLAIAADAARSEGGELLLEDSARYGGLRAVLSLPAQSL